MTEHPSTNWETYMQQVERRLRVLSGFIETRAEHDSSGLRRAIIEQLEELRLFLGRPCQ